jgi:hypothetical protein
VRRIYRGDSRIDNNLTRRRFRHPAAHEMPAGLFRWLGNSQYEAIIEGALCRFTVKAYTPGGYWRVFYTGPDDLTCTELNRRFRFDTPAQAMWLEMANAAYAQRIDDDRAAEAEAASPAPTDHCPEDAIPF